MNMLDLIPKADAVELPPAIAWEMWDTAVAALETPSPTTSPAWAERVARNAVPPWAVGARP